MVKSKRVKGIKSLANIAHKCNLDREELLEGVREAWEKGESRCGDLNITCRVKTKENAIFLFESEDVLHQFPIRIDVLRTPQKRATWRLY